MTCLGCGRSIPWDGKGVFSYTCLCGGHAFRSDAGKTSFSVSVLVGTARDIPPHLDYVVGLSPHINKEKLDLIRQLRSLGAVWSWECPECREKGRCPFRWQCSRFTSLSPDDKAVVSEFCMTVRHTDCPRYTELRDQVVAMEGQEGP